MPPVKFTVEDSEQMQAAEQQLRDAGKLNGKIAPAPNKPLVLSVADVMGLKVEPRSELIRDVLPSRGASLIFGKQKSNKTLLAVQAAIDVAGHTPFLDNYPVLRSGPVLLLTQDDPDGGASVQELFKASPIFSAKLPIHTVPAVPFNFGILFVEWLESEIIEKGLVFVVLDSYTKLRGSRTSGVDIVKAEQLDLSMLDELGKRTNCSILIIHHTSKGSASLDWSDQAAGTFAMSASTENQIHISRFSELLDNAPERLIRIRGRHTNGTQLVVAFRQNSLDHELVLEGGAAALFPLLRTLETSFGDRPFSPKDLQLETGVSRATASRQIERLLQSDAIRKRGYGDYVLSVRQLSTRTGRQ